MKFLRLYLALTVSILCSGANVFANTPGDDASAGYRLYDSQDYRGAVKVLSGAVKGASAGDARAHLYLGNAWMKLGKPDYARYYYTRALSLKPTEQMTTYLKLALDKSLAAGSAANAAASTGANADADVKKMSKGKGLKDLPLADRTMVEVYQNRKTKDTDFVLDQVASALSALEESTKRTLREGGCKILISHTILTARPDMRGVKPRGYLHGGGYDNCPGMFDPSTKTLYVPEKASWRNSPPQLNRWVKEVALHELGHAYDHCLKEASERADYRKAVNQDHQKLTNTLRRTYWYYTQPGAGESELFAELFAVVHGAAESEDQEKMPLFFPTTTKYMKDLLGK